MSPLTQTKARRLLSEGRVTVTRKIGDEVRARVRGDRTTYDVSFDPIGLRWRCTCKSRYECSHELAVALVTVPNTTTPLKAA
jgi:uncharacterized Zn finger protein